MTSEQMAECFDCAQNYIKYAGLWNMLKYKDILFCKRHFIEKVNRALAANGGQSL